MIELNESQSAAIYMAVEMGKRHGEDADVVFMAALIYVLHDMSYERNQVAEETYQKVNAVRQQARDVLERIMKEGKKGEIKQPSLLPLQQR